MFAAERLNIIRKIMLERKQVDVITLSNILSVSEVTVRRDLEKLEEDNFLTRTHGGAVLNDIDNFQPTSFLNIAEDEFVKEKMTIGKIALFLVNDNDTIILGPGNTSLYIAREIKVRKNLKIVTNDIKVAIEILSDSNGAKVVLSGGDIDPTTLQLTGKIAEMTLDSIFVSKAFVEVDGVSFEKGYTVESTEKATIIQKIFSVSKEVYAVCDHHKFSQISFSQLGNIDLFHKIISNEQTPDEYKKYYFNNNIQLFTTFNVYEEKY
jgi:DeoR family transcriptional regulator, fructose operon transcriptional repressor